MAKEIEKPLPAKPVGLFSKVTSHRTDKEMTEEKKYEIKDDDGNISFTREQQLDDTENINSANINDSDGRLILESLFISFLLFQDFIKYLSQQIRIGCTTIQQYTYCKFFKGVRMLVNINVFFLFNATTVSTCINTSVRHCNVNGPNTTSVSL